ncbi:TetR/AcrR family transcriptional regulator [Maritalea mediterranea]|uniref:TetR/AcrR family transcriptional regulator n=1 Tax=Maritalea mediterranea TaxID=2909667 RepID=A0ABS9E9J6_9HYPH|nr:TetR/AcrR family transcriptional regulator [Maritalea mediterranea]MCF4099531.1 TetR/AcrR family transcriptional regulator [Maritalea mediterranea]
MARKKDEALHKRRKAEILQGARACFIDKGIHQTSMQDICQRSQISPGALYRYFPSKQSIIEAIAAGEQQSNAELIDHLRAARDPVAALSDALPDLLDHILDHDFARLMVEISSEASRNPAVYKPFAAIDQQFRTDLTNIFAARHKFGPFGSADQTAQQVFVLLSLIDGLVARAANNDLPPRKQLDPLVWHTIRQLFA